MLTSLNNEFKPFVPSKDDGPKNGARPRALLVGRGEPPPARLIEALGLDRQWNYEWIDVAGPGASSLEIMPLLKVYKQLALVEVVVVVGKFSHSAVSALKNAENTPIVLVERALVEDNSTTALLKLNAVKDHLRQIFSQWIYRTGGCF